jgi:hypothetical protein
MHSVANKLAQYGRGGDDTLVHMNHAEVAGLNALNHLVNKRPLSKNPVTGMTEAMDLTDILAGLGIGIAAALTGGAAAAAAPALLGATAGAAGGAGAMGLGALAGAATGAGLNAGKAAIKGDQDIGQAAMFGAGSGALGGLGGAAGVGGEAAQGVGNTAMEGMGEAAKTSLTTATENAIPGLGGATTDLSTTATKSGLENIVPSATNNTTGLGGIFPTNSAAADLSSATQNAIPKDLASLSNAGVVQPQSSMGNIVTSDLSSSLDKAIPSSVDKLSTPGPWEQSYIGLKNTVMNPGQHQGMIAAQLGAAGLEDQYKQQGLTEQAGAKQAADIVQQYKNAGIMPNELPKGLTDIANRRKSFAVGGTIRDVQGLGAIPTGYINQQSMNDFHPQSMIPQAQPLQSTQPIRHEVIGYADGGQVGYGYAEGGDVGGGDEGLLHGPGTGQSDGISGIIEGAQSQEPVRLADGEFVIPADVVSALGSGSTKAGAKALYDMLDRIRQQAYGHLQQANQVDPQAVMPV